MTRTQQRVLGLLYGQPDRSFYASEVIRLAGAGSGAAQRELAKLEATGLTVVRRIGLQKHHQANQASPLFHELRSVVLKTVAFADRARDVLERVSPGIHAAFLYGPVGAEPGGPEGDIEVLVISDSLTYADVFAALTPIAASVGRQISPRVYAAADFLRRRREQNAFVTRALQQPKVWLIGSEQDLPHPP